MASPFLVACSQCGSKLKLKDESFVGKKVKCPKCQTAFVVHLPKPKKPAPAKAPPEDDFEFLDGVGNDDLGGGDATDEFEEDLPAAPGRKTVKSARKRKPSGSGNSRKVLLVLGAILAALVVGGGIGYGILSLVRVATAEGPSRMAWLPDDTDLFMEIEVADLWRAAALREFRDQQVLNEGLLKMQSLGLKPEDLERVVIGGSMAGGSTENPVGVFYARRPFNLEAIRRELELVDKGDYKGKQLFASGNDVGFLAEPAVAVIGPEAVVKAAIDRNGVCAAMANFEPLPERADFLLISRLPRTPAATTTPADGAEAGPMAGASGPLDMLGVTTGIDVSTVSRIALSLNVSRDIEVKTTLDCTTPESAGKIKAETEKALSSAKAGLVRTKERISTQRSQLLNSSVGSEILKPLVEMQEATVAVTESVLSTMQMKQAGGRLDVTLTITGDAMEKLSKLTKSGQLPFGMPGLPTAPPMQAPEEPAFDSRNPPTQ